MWRSVVFLFSLGNDASIAFSLSSPSCTTMDAATMAPAEREKGQRIGGTSLARS